MMRAEATVAIHARSGVAVHKVPAVRWTLVPSLAHSQASPRCRATVTATPSDIVRACSRPHVSRTR